MRKLVLLCVVAIALGAAASCLAQTVEMAAKCPDAMKKLEALVKNPDLKHFTAVKDALGIDILASCEVPGGSVACFQCLDTDQNLKTIQLFQDKASGRFTLKGFGCQCTQTK